MFVYRNCNLSFLHLDPNRTGLVDKTTVRTILSAHGLLDGKAGYLISRLDRNGGRNIAFVELLNEIVKQDYPTFDVPPAMGPDLKKKHNNRVKGMTERSNYTGSLSGSSRGGGSERGDATDRSKASSVAIRNSAESGEGGSFSPSGAGAMTTGVWPGHRQMTYSSPGSSRSEKVPRLPSLSLSPDRGGNYTGGAQGPASNTSGFAGFSGRTDRSEAAAASSLPFMRRSPSKGSHKYTFNLGKLGHMKHGCLYKELNEQFLAQDSEGRGFLTEEEITGICSRLCMENFASVLSAAVLTAAAAASRGQDRGGRVSYVDFANGLKQRLEPGLPALYLGTAPARPGERTGRSGSGRGRRGGGTGRSGTKEGGGSYRKRGSPNKQISTIKNGRNEDVAAFADELGRIDVSGTGKMGAGEIRRVCTQFQIPEDQLDLVLHLCSVDAAGHLSYMEFVNVLKREVMAQGGHGEERLPPQEEEGGGGGDSGGDGGGRGLNGPPAAGNASLSPPREYGGGEGEVAPVSPELISKLHAKHAHLTKAFTHSDRRQTGYLEEREIRRLCQIYHLPLEMTEKALGGCDGSSGKISYAEFTNNVMRREVRKCSSY